MEHEAEKTADANREESIELKPHEDYVKVISKLVPDPFIVCLKRATAKAVRKKFREMAAYTPHELKVLEKANADKKLLNKIHAVKKVFPGARIDKLVAENERGGDVAK